MKTPHLLPDLSPELLAQAMQWLSVLRSDDFAPVLREFASDASQYDDLVYQEIPKEKAQEFVRLLDATTMLTQVLTIAPNAIVQLIGDDIIRPYLIAHQHLLPIKAHLDACASGLYEDPDRLEFLASSQANAAERYKDEPDWDLADVSLIYVNPFFKP